MSDFRRSIEETIRKEVHKSNNTSAEGAAYLQPMKSIEASGEYKEAQRSSSVTVVFPQAPDAAGTNTRYIKQNVPFSTIPNGTYFTPPSLQNILADVVNDKGVNMKCVGMRPVGEAIPFGRNVAVSPAPDLTVGETNAAAQASSWWSTMQTKLLSWLPGPTASTGPPPKVENNAKRIPDPIPFKKPSPTTTALPSAGGLMNQSTNPNSSTAKFAI